MLITIKIDLEKSGQLFHELLNNKDVEIIQMQSNPAQIIVVDSWKKPDSMVAEFITAERCIDNKFDQATLFKFEELFNFVGLDSSWFVHILSLTRRKAKFCYLDSILIQMSRLFHQVFSRPIMRLFFYRKCFMVLKDFRNIRRCYKF